MAAASDAELILLAPLSGQIVALNAVPDPAFAEGLLGDGMAINPPSGQTSVTLLAPCAGMVQVLAKTQHAITLQAQTGAEILLHIGIDTVEMKGQSFTAHVREGQQVQEGDELITFNPVAIVQAGFNPLTLVLIANSDRFPVLVRSADSQVQAAASVLMLVGAAGSAPAVEPTTPSGPAATQAAQTVRQSATLGQAGGLHARPAARWRAAVQGLSAQVHVHFEGRSAHIDSIVALLGLGAGQGAVIDIEATGPEAQKALDAVLAQIAMPETESESDGMDTQAHADAAPPDSVQGGVAADWSREVEQCLPGVSAARGVATGTLFWWQQTRITPPEKATQPIAAEQARLASALQQCDADLSHQAELAEQQGSKSTHAIFTMHRALLQDAQLCDTAKALIAEGKDAGFAFGTAIAEQVQVLERLQDTRLAERASDLRDLERQVFRHLGLEPSLTQRVQQIQSLDRPLVLAAEEFTPSDLAQLHIPQVRALVMCGGGATSHAAIMARQRGLPTLVALGQALRAVAQDTPVIVDGLGGQLLVSPSAKALARAEQLTQQQAQRQKENQQNAQNAAITQDGKSIEIAANVATLDDAQQAIAHGADAIGLLRTELMFIHRPTAPTLEEQQSSYEGILRTMQGRSVIIRTLDIGADKDVDYVTLPPEPNPALGLRGVRLAAVRPDLLETQLRALLQSKPYAALRILLPMITDAQEFLQLRQQVDTLCQHIGRDSPVQLGAMIEVPAAALMAQELARYADFLSIGTNDLTQYTLAMDRCRPDLAARADGLHPAVLRLIDMTVRGAQQHGKWVGVCGALAGDTSAVPILLGLGVHELSVDPVNVADVKAQVRSLSFAQCQATAQQCLTLDSAQAVRAASRQAWPN